MHPLILCRWVAIQFIGHRAGSGTRECSTTLPTEDHLARKETFDEAGRTPAQRISTASYFVGSRPDCGGTRAAAGNGSRAACGVEATPLTRHGEVAEKGLMHTRNRKGAGWATTP
jgi:hypothetical protein